MPNLIRAPKLIRPISLSKTPKKTSTHYGRRKKITIDTKNFIAIFNGRLKEYRKLASANAQLRERGLEVPIEQKQREQKMRSGLCPFVVATKKTPEHPNARTVLDKMGYLSKRFDPLDAEFGYNTLYWAAKQLYLDLHNKTQNRPLPARKPMLFGE